jgi:hypothetical protein
MLLSIMFLRRILNTRALYNVFIKLSLACLLRHSLCIVFFICAPIDLFLLLILLSGNSFVLTKFTIFLQLAKKFHPNTNKDVDAEKKFQEINRAYEV